MKTKPTLLLIVGLAFGGLNSAAPQARAADNEAVFQDTPIDVVLSSLAQLAGLNIHIDQKIREPIVGAGGKLQTNLVTINWKNITPDKAFTALVDNYGYTATLDPKTGVTRVAMKDPTLQEPTQVRILALKYANVSNMVSVVKAALSARSQATVQADARTGQLIFAATDAEFTQVTNLVAKLDAAVAQVLIEARFMETAKNPKSIKGIDWTGTLEKQNFLFGNGITEGTTTTTIPGSTTTSPGVPLPNGAPGTPTSTTKPFDAVTTLTTTLGMGGIEADTARGFYPSTAFLSAEGVRAVLSFLNTDSDTESIATPRAVTMDGVSTELSVVRNVPIFEETQGAISGGIQNANTVKPNYELKVGQAVLNEVGIKLLVTPRIVGSDKVQLELKPEISAMEAVSAKVTLGGKVSESPIFTRRKLLTTATVPTGNTLVLGGLLSDETVKTHSKVPILGDIPVLGYAFRRDTKERNKRNLIIFVTPTIVSDGDFQPNAAAANFLKTKHVDKPDIEEPAWETGKPMDRNRSFF